MRSILPLIITAAPWVCMAADPSIGFVRVPQDSIRVLDNRCTGIIEVDIQDADGDTLLAGIQISSDGGATWTVPLQSDYFLRLAPGLHRIPFEVPGFHGDNCRAKITVYDTLPNDKGMRLVPAADHAFLMGSDSGRGEEAPKHPVAFTHDYWMDTTEISEAAFKLFKPDYRPEYLGLFFYEANKPVDNCFWHWAVRCCNWRSAQEGLDSCYSGFPDTGNSEFFGNYFAVACDREKNGYRLPTEAEWEYACRAGVASRFPWGDDSARAGEYCWYRGNFHDTIHAPAQRLPNRFGLYDMNGCMLELCNDWYDSAYYARSPEIDPAGPSAPAAGDIDPFRVTRGGYFLSSVNDVSNSARLGNFSSARHPQSFRCVRTVMP